MTARLAVIALASFFSQLIPVASGGTQSFSFEPATLFFGIKNDIESSKMSAQLCNRSNVDVFVENIKPSCGCITDIVPSRCVIKANEAVKIEFTANLKKKRGFQEVSLTVSLKNQKELPVLKIQGWVLPEQKIVPSRQRINLTFSEDTQRISLQGMKEDLENTSVNLEKDLIRCEPVGEIVPAEIQGISKKEFDVSAIPNARGWESSSLVFKSGDAPDVLVPVLCSPSPTNDTYTEQLFIGRISDKLTFQKEILIASADKVDFEAKDSEISLGHSEIIKKEGNKTLYLLSLVVRRARVGVLRSTINVKNANSGANIGRLNIVGYVEK